MVNPFLLTIFICCGRDKMKAGLTGRKTMNDRLLNQLCLDWVHWCYTRRFYIAPGGKSQLGVMQPSKLREPPDARNNADMQFFNMAVHTLADMKEHHDAMVCFNLYYVEQADNIKRKADELGISRPTYYSRARAFARKAHELAQCLKAAHNAGAITSAARAAEVQQTIV